MENADFTGIRLRRGPAMGTRSCNGKEWFSCCGWRNLLATPVRRVNALAGVSPWRGQDYM
jgi:hypothetical protein